MRYYSCLFPPTPPSIFFLHEATVNIFLPDAIWSTLTRLLYILVILALEKESAVAFVGEML